MKDVSQELHNETPEPTILDFDDDIPYAEYESFSYGLDFTKGLDVGIHVEYESFSFNPIIHDLLFELDDNILYVEYKSFCEFDIHGSADDVMLIMSPSLLTPSKRTSFLNIASLNLLNLRSLPLEILL